MRKTVIITASLLACFVIFLSIIITGATAFQYFTCPDDFKLSTSSEYLMSGGYEITVTAQLYKNGQPHMLSGLQIFFEVPRGPYYAAQIVDGQGSPPTYVYLDTDDNGQASITLKSEGLADDYEIEVKAYVMIAKGDQCYIGQFRTLDVTILAWGRIEGTIRDFLQYPVPGAILTIYPGAEYKQNTQSWEHDTVPLDTRYSSDGTETLLGYYSFEPLTIGTYYLEVDVTHMAPAGVTTTTFEIVDITQAKMYPLDINIPNFMMPTVTSIPVTTVTTVTTVTATECPDTDGDLWDDCYEEIVGTNPYIQDTDNDGWIDSLDPNPLLPFTATTTLNTPTSVLPVLISLGAIVVIMASRRK